MFKLYLILSDLLLQVTLVTNIKASHNGKKRSFKRQKKTRLIMVTKRHLIGN